VRVGWWKTGDDEFEHGVPIPRITLISGHPICLTPYKTAAFCAPVTATLPKRFAKFRMGFVMAGRCLR
jgi:hypothetical protein